MKIKLYVIFKIKRSWLLLGVHNLPCMFTSFNKTWSPHGWFTSSDLTPFASVMPLVHLNRADLRVSPADIIWPPSLPAACAYLCSPPPVWVTHCVCSQIGSSNLKGFYQRFHQWFIYFWSPHLINISPHKTDFTSASLTAFELKFGVVLATSHLQLVVWVWHLTLLHEIDPHVIFRVVQNGYSCIVSKHKIILV